MVAGTWDRLGVRVKGETVAGLTRIGNLLLAQIRGTTFSGDRRPAILDLAATVKRKVRRVESDISKPVATPSGTVIHPAAICPESHASAFSLTSLARAA
jgi:hypothetical protein